VEELKKRGDEVDSSFDDNARTHRPASSHRQRIHDSSIDSNASTHKAQTTSPQPYPSKHRDTLLPRWNFLPIPSSHSRNSHFQTLEDPHPYIFEPRETSDSDMVEDATHGGGGSDFVLDI
jgi:hypothetical protein